MRSQGERNRALPSPCPDLLAASPLPSSPAGDRRSVATVDPRELYLPPPPSYNDLHSDRSSSGDSQPASRTRGKLRDRSASQSGLNSPGSGTTSPRIGDYPSPPLDGKRRGRAIRRKPQKSSGSVASTCHDLTAWIITAKGREPYDVSLLTSGQEVSELWNDQGNLTVTIFDKRDGTGPSFKVDASVIASSKLLTTFAYGAPQNQPLPAMPRRADTRQGHERGRSVSSNCGHSFGHHSQQYASNKNLSSPAVLTIHSPLVESPEANTMNSTSFQDMANPQQEIDLYIPLGITASQSTLPADDLEALVSVRNLFAFLTGHFMVGTPRQPTPFAIFNNIAGLLKYYEFSNLDGTTLGEIPTSNFGQYVEDLHLNDVRSSREKTIEAIVLGERMQSSLLYNEGYVHGVGKYDELVQLEANTFSWITRVTRKRMEKSSLELSIRLHAMRLRLQDLEFPGLFAGIASSKSAGKGVDSRTLKEGFAGMRKHVTSQYRQRYGSWPPKAKSKKNDFEESGLNRLLLQDVYQDFSHLYDLLVDRMAPTPRLSQTNAHNEPLSEDPRLHLLRRLLDEFDHSSPPVQPPIPFDLPIIPRLESTRRDFATLPEKTQAKERGKKLKDDEIHLALMQASNYELSERSPFVHAFTQFEREAAHGKSIDEIAYLRLGQWLFLYVVLQSLPLVVVDAPGLHFTHGLEYFLCAAPKGLPPWAKDDTAQQPALYRVAGGSSVVALPSDLVDHSVDSIYQRSHCWQVAAQWSHPAHPTPMDSSSRTTLHKPLSSAGLRSRSAGRPPLHLRNSTLHAVRDSTGHATSGLTPSTAEPRTPHRRPLSFQDPNPNARRASFVGLEPLALPPTFGALSAAGGARRVSTPDPTASFESILGAVLPPVVQKKKRWDSLGGSLGGSLG